MAIDSDEVWWVRSAIETAQSVESLRSLYQGLSPDMQQIFEASFRARVDKLKKVKR